MKTIKYQRIETMTPREGVAYATRYLKQSLEQRQELSNHIFRCTRQLLLAALTSTAVDLDRPLKGFKTTTGSNRSATQVLQDAVNEAQGKKRDGRPKDYALAPIERWNKLFKGTDYEIQLVQADGMKANNFNDIMDF